LYLFDNLIFCIVAARIARSALATAQRDAVTQRIIATFDAVKKKKKKNIQIQKIHNFFFFFFFCQMHCLACCNAATPTSGGSASLCALIFRVLRANENSAASLWAVRAIERDVDADAPSDAAWRCSSMRAMRPAGVNDISVLKCRWVLRNRIAVGSRRCGSGRLRQRSVRRSTSRGGRRGDSVDVGHIGL
jgi:hypothetical protein